MKLDWILVATVKEKLGQTSGKGAYNEKESLWWNDDTRRATKAKEEAFKAYQKDKSEEQHCAYKEANKAAKRAVAIAKEEAYDELYTKLDTREGAKIIYKLAKSRDRRSRDISDIAYVKDEHGTILTESGKIKERWNFLFDKLFNAENPREQLDELPTTEGPVEWLSLDEVKKQMEKMGKGKACGPDELPIEAVHIILDYKPECIVEAFNNILRTNKMPNDWRKSRMVPIFKGKGGVLECNTYRGIKLISHTMKLWERMIEARLREITKIAHNQFGLRPGKSTTEPIFALRMLQEKYREKNKELHMVFVDLEKAYGRVPRELIWWSLRKKRVPEAYIKIIQDMYEDCETQVTTREGSQQRHMEQSVGRLERKTRTDCIAEMRMLRWIRGKTRKDHVRNTIIQEYANVCQMSTFLRQKRLHWYGHVKRREEDNLSRKMMDMVVPGKRRRRRPRLRWTDNNREDMTKYELTADMTENRQYWKMMVKTGPQRSEDGL